MTEQPGDPRVDGATPGRDLVHDDGAERGSLTIADKAVERIASLAAREVDAVTDTGSRWSLPLTSSSLPRATAKVAGSRSRISVEVAAQWPACAGEVAAQVRDHVLERVTLLTGMTVDAVDVTVADVVHVETERRRVR